MLPFRKTLLRTYFEQGLMHVVVDYLTFLILLNDFVRGVSRHALFILRCWRFRLWIYAFFTSTMQTELHPQPTSVLS